MPRSSTEQIFDRMRDEMVGQNEIADYAGVSPSTVRKWKQRYDDFPEPVARLAIGPVWLLSDVVGWLRETGRRHTGPDGLV